VGLKPRPRSGDSLREPAFEQFVADSSTWLWRSAYLLTGDRSAAEDLLQLTLLRTARRWRAAQRAPAAYARRVLVNLVRGRHRQAGRRVTERTLEEANGTGPHALSLDPADAVARRDEVFDALAQLPAEQREVLVIRLYADLSAPETAAAIGTPQGTVKSRTSRALARMRELLADPFTAPDQPAPHEVAKDDSRTAH
jgi:RNA polymerase sigma-70 factor (sigma-E family)